MAYPSVTYTFTNGTVASGPNVSTNFSDLVAGLSDGTKDLSINAFTAAGAATFNGAVTLGNATGDDITVTGYVASDFLPKTAATYDLGSATQTWCDLYTKGTTSLDGAVTINDTGADVDFRVESDTNANMFFVDASTSKIGVGTNSPDCDFHIAQANQTEGYYVNKGFLLAEQVDTGNGLCAFIRTADEVYLGPNKDNSSGTCYFVLGVNFDSSTNKKDAICIRQDGSVGIGTVSSSDLDPGARNLVVGDGGGQRGITIYSSTSTNGNIYFADGTSGSTLYRGYVQYQHSTDAMLLGTAGSTRLTIANDGTFTGSASNDISDARLKENISDIENGLATILKIKGRTFNWKPDADMPTGKKYGFIAQEIEQVIPELVYSETGIRKMDDGTWNKSVQATGIIPILVKAIQELSAKITALESRI